MKKNYQSIQTIYKGMRFYSRLEATWACFFDLLKWQWEYHPRTFKCWLPTFAIYGSDIIYVAVERVFSFPWHIANKIEKSGCDKECLILPESLFFLQDCHHDLSFGWFREGTYIDDGIKWFWEEAVLGHCAKSKTLGFCHPEGIYYDRISGGCGCKCSGRCSLPLHTLIFLWAQAKINLQAKSTNL
jgi:hypothetical protein